MKPSTGHATVPDAAVPLRIARGPATIRVATAMFVPRNRAAAGADALR